MRQVLLPSLLAMGVAGGCAGHRAAATAPPPRPPAAAADSTPPPVESAKPEPALTIASRAEADVFRAQVAPLLAQRCAPCHNPGGKMYDSMPFDDPGTITAHAEGILRRIKTPDEHALIERWIASRPKS